MDEKPIMSEYTIYEHDYHVLTWYLHETYKDSKIYEVYAYDRAVDAWWAKNKPEGIPYLHKHIFKLGSSEYL